MLRSAEPFDEEWLLRALQSALEHADGRGVRNVVLACADQYDKCPGTLIERMFLPALRHLGATQDFSWIRMSWVSWMGKAIIEALDEAQASVVLEVLLPYPHLEYAAEDITASIAKRWPGLVIDFLGKRQRHKRTGQAAADFDAIPFNVHDLRAPLAAAPDLMLSAARQWFDEDPLHFPFDGGRLLASVFPELTHGLGERLARLVVNGAEIDLAFALTVLSAFEGKPIVYDHVRSIVAALDVGSPLVRKARSVLQESGVVSGEFGFVELLTQRKALVRPWLADENHRVRAFAESQIRLLEQRMAAETRSAEASIALRRLGFGEDLDDGNEPADGG